MWRALIAPRAALLGAALTVGIALTALRAGPAPPGGFEAEVRPGAPAEEVARRNVAALAADRFGLVADGDTLRLVSTDDAPFGVGAPTVAWFTAPPEPGALPDLFALRLRLSALGVPVAVGSPVNITRTSSGAERLLDAAAGRVLYATWVADRAVGAVVLDFDHPWLRDDAGFALRAVAAVAARQRFGTPVGPARTDLVFLRPAEAVSGALTADGARITLGDTAVAVTLPAGTQIPPGRIEVQRSAPERPAFAGLFAEVVRSSAVVGGARVMSIERVWSSLSDWVRRQHHRVFPTAADRLAVTATVDAPATDAWPPPDLDLGGARGLPGEGRWVAVEALSAEADPPARRTFLRVDPRRPFVETHLFAFDMTRLGLHFAAGARHPASATGARGSGRVPDARRARLVAAFNGGLGGDHGAFGVVEDGRVLIAPNAGLATVVTDDDGHAGFGLWDAEALTPPWRSLRQNLPPLITDGLVNPARARHWGEGVAGVDDAQLPRSAVGVTGAGVLIYAWCAATSAERLGEAMKRAGARFAMHLDLTPGETGTEFYRPGPGGQPLPEAGHPSMDHRRGRWLGTDARDFFYVVRAGEPPGQVARRESGWAPGEGVWTRVGVTGDDPSVTRTFFTPARVGGRAQVEVLRLDSARLRAHVVPGMAEARPAGGLPAVEMGLFGVPVAWIEIGLRAPQSPYGLVAAQRAWRPVQPGIMSLVVDGAGDARVGRLGEGGLAAQAGWAEVVQGPSLLVSGEPTQAARGLGGLPAVGLGQDASGALLLASAVDGDRAALAAALQRSGARDALLMGELGTATTGTLRRFVQRGDRFLMIDGVAGRPRPAIFAAGAGTALIFTGRRPAPGARILDTFETAAAVR